MQWRTLGACLRTGSVNGRLFPLPSRERIQVRVIWPTVGNSYQMTASSDYRWRPLILTFTPRGEKGLLRHVPGAKRAVRDYVSLLEGKR